MQNLHSKNTYTIQLSKSQLLMLDKLLHEEIARSESGTSQHLTKSLIATHQKIWHHIQPSPAEKHAKVEAWVRAIYKNRSEHVLQSLAR